MSSSSKRIQEINKSIQETHDIISSLYQEKRTANEARIAQLNLEVRHHYRVLDALIELRGTILESSTNLWWFSFFQFLAVVLVGAGVGLLLGTIIGWTFPR